MELFDLYVYDCIAEKETVLKNNLTEAEVKVEGDKWWESDATSPRLSLVSRSVNDRGRS